MSKIVKLDQKVPLHSTGKSKGTSYTATEKGTARAVLIGVLIAIGKIESKELEAEVPDEVVEAISAAAEPGLGVPNICRKAYRQLESAHFAGDDNEPVDKENWPKVRDYTSIGLIFRKQLAKLNKETGALEEKEADGVFPAYRAKKKEKTIAS